MSKSSSTKFFGAAGVYNNFNSTAFAQQLTDTLSGNTPTQQAQVTNTNVVDVAAEQAGQQIDALAQATKAGLTRQINTVASAAGNTTAQPSPTIVTTATLTATTTATPPNGTDTTAGATTIATGATDGTTSTDSSTTTTTSATVEKPAEKPTDAAIDAGKFDVPGSEDDLKETTPTTTTPPPIVVAPVVAPVSTNYSTGTYILIAIAAFLVLLFVIFVGYMLYTKKSASETFAALKANFSNAFAKKPSTTNTTI